MRMKPKYGCRVCLQMPAPLQAHKQRCNCTRKPDAGCRVVQGQQPYRCRESVKPELQLQLRVDPVSAERDGVDKVFAQVGQAHMEVAAQKEGPAAGDGQGRSNRSRKKGAGKGFSGCRHAAATRRLSELEGCLRNS